MSYDRKTRTLTEFTLPSACAIGPDEPTTLAADWFDIPEDLLNDTVPDFESSPPESPPREMAAKQATGKIDVTLLPLLALTELARVGHFGTKKYAAHNFRKGCPDSVALASAWRHMLKFMYGQDLDSESGCLHAAHAAWWLLTLTENILLGNGVRDTGDITENLPNDLLERLEHDDLFSCSTDGPDSKTTE